ncbi:MAG: hypothetical protein WA584_10185 [Pyrinomonadaceae bacterium]
MRFQIIFFTTILIFTFFLTGCPSNPNPLNTNTNTTNNSTNAANNAANNSVLIPKKTPEAPTENNAPTITPVVKAYYDALKKKDDAALKKVLTADFIKSVEADMKDEKKTSIAAYMAEYEVLDKPVETRNEKIEGDKASAEIKGGTYVNWTKFNFVKENGEWKFTNQFDDNEKMK